MSPQIKNSNFGLYKYLRVAPHLFMNWLQFAEGTLYKANILKLGDLVLSSTAQISKVCFVQWRYQYC
jgi:hypothetical protein